MTSGGNWPEVGQDALDLGDRPVSPRPGWLAYRRLTLGSRPTATPALLFVVIGFALGRHGMNLLTVPVITNSQALIWVGLAVTGVFVGLGLSARSATPRRSVGLASGIIALTTVGVMTAGLYVLSSQAHVPLSGSLGAAVVLLALSTSVSAAVPTPSRATRELEHAARLADLDDIPLVVGGVVVIAILSGDSAVLRVCVTIAAGAALGMVGCLLFSHASETERGLFVTGIVLLLAGTATYLGTSPLASGCAAAIVWSRLPGTADRITAEDLRTLQHPLVVLILIFAGAVVEITVAAVWVAAITVVLRLAAKLLVSVIVSRLASASPSLLASVLLQPGVLGVALAMNAWLLLGDDYRWLVSAVVLTTVASEVLALVTPHPTEAVA